MRIKYPQLKLTDTPLTARPELYAAVGFTYQKKPTIRFPLRAKTDLHLSLRPKWRHTGALRGRQTFITNIDWMFSRCPLTLSQSWYYIDGEIILFIK